MIGESMKNRGFTLVELLCVIILIALLMTIAVPNALRMANRVREKSYDTKIDLIEDAAVSYGQSNLTLVRKGTDPENNASHSTCKFVFDKNKEVSKLTYRQVATGYSENASLEEDEHWCFRVTLDKLVNSNELDWDNKNQCNDKCTEEQKKNYDNTIINPRTRNIINKCYVYVYYRFNRVYAYFDKSTCSVATSDVSLGHEYKPLA